MQGSIGSRVCRSVQSCWTHHRIRSYQRLPATTPTCPVAARGVRLGRRRPVLVAGSTAWSFGQLRAKARWSPPLQLLGRTVGACLNSVLPRSLKIANDDALAAAVVPRKGGASPPKTMRRAVSRHGEIDRRGVMLNLCVAEVLLRRSSSEVRRSPLRPRKLPA